MLARCHGCCYLAVARRAEFDAHGFRLIWWMRVRFCERSASDIALRTFRFLRDPGRYPAEFAGAAARVTAALAKTGQAGSNCRKTGPDVLRLVQLVAAAAAAWYHTESNVV